MSSFVCPRIRTTIRSTNGLSFVGSFALFHSGKKSVISIQSRVASDRRLDTISPIHVPRSWFVPFSTGIGGRSQSFHRAYEVFTFLRIDQSPIYLTTPLGVGRPFEQSSFGKILRSSGVERSSDLQSDCRIRYASCTILDFMSRFHGTSRIVFDVASLPALSLHCARKVSPSLRPYPGGTIQASRSGHSEIGWYEGNSGVSRSFGRLRNPGLVLLEIRAIRHLGERAQVRAGIHSVRKTDLA